MIYTHINIHVYVYMICLFIYPSIYLCIYLGLSIHLSFHIHIYISIYLYSLLYLHHSTSISIYPCVCVCLRCVQLIVSCNFQSANRSLRWAPSTSWRASTGPKCQSGPVSLCNSLSTKKCWSFHRVHWYLLDSKVFGRESNLELTRWQW